jgi:UDP-N-acetylglucosamine 2-epimerase (non-hydrolysing)/GDP/UDP-N,N'-diacetylbacillosamine 2-epimerase (hydrolysing)
MVVMKVLAFTSNRADYDLLSPLYQLLNEDSEVVFSLCVSGAHLSDDYGYSVQQIRADGLPVLIELETLLGYDTNRSKLKSGSLFLQNSIDLVAHFLPDVILFAGDREDVIFCALLGVYLGIPTIHFYGGDHEKAGHEDTLVRHATSKLATLHFVSCQEHVDRLRSLGEPAQRIFNIGSVALDRFHQFNCIDKNQLMAQFNIVHAPSIALLIYHPSPDAKENELADIVIDNILSELISRDKTVFVSSPNTDAGNHKIRRSLADYDKHPRVVAFQNLDRTHFLSLFSHAELIIGNSSAGLMESGSIPLPAVNVGHRQADRYCGENVLFCDYDRLSIGKAIDRACSLEFRQKIAKMKNPFGDGQSAQRAYQLIKTLPLSAWKAKTEDPLYD